MIKFGFKRRGKQEEEMLFGHPYLEMDVKPADIGKVCKFWFKNGVRDLLEFNKRENKLSWMFDETKDNEFYLINVSSAPKGEVEPIINVNLALDFNNKPLFERMEKLMDLDTKNRNYFHLVKAENISGFPAVRIVPTDVPSDLQEKEESAIAELEQVANDSETQEKKEVIL